MDSEINRKLAKMIKEQKNKLGIVSLSDDEKNTLMWTHYANEFKGVAVGVDIVEESGIDKKDVIYDDNLTYNSFATGIIDLNQAKKKLECLKKLQDKIDMLM